MRLSKAGVKIDDDLLSVSVSAGCGEIVLCTSQSLGRKATSFIWRISDRFPDIFLGSWTLMAFGGKMAFGGQEVFAAKGTMIALGEIPTPCMIAR